jgi:hypothetical protein
MARRSRPENILIPVACETFCCDWQILMVTMVTLYSLLQQTGLAAPDRGNVTVTLSRTVALYRRSWPIILRFTFQLTIVCTVVPSQRAPNPHRWALSRMSRKTHPLHQKLTRPLEIAQLKGVPLIRSPQHTLVPPSPLQCLHHFLAALRYRSQ